jgi:hypothetical protein
MSNRGEKLLKIFNENGWDYIEKYVGEFDVFYNVLKKYGLNGRISIKEIPEEMINKVSYEMMSDYPERVLDYVINNELSDVDKRGDDYYLRLRDRDEVADFFKDSNHNYSAKDVVKKMMSDDYWEPFDYDSEDIYDDVIDNLDKNNLTKLKQRILNELNGVEIEIDDNSSEDMIDIAVEQGHEEYLYVTPENIDRVVGDSETMNLLLDGYLDDLNSNLHSIYRSAVNDAYSGEIFKKINSELSIYFDPKIKYETIKNGDKQRTIMYLKINDFPSIINDYYTHYKDSPYDADRMSYHGNFTGILTQMMDEVGGYDYLDFRTPDYPDWSLTKNSINEVFSEYI